MWHSGRPRDPPFQHVVAHLEPVSLIKRPATRRRPEEDSVRATRLTLLETRLQQGRPDSGRSALRDYEQAADVSMELGLAHGLGIFSRSWSHAAPIG